MGCATPTSASRLVKIVDPSELAGVKGKCEYVGLVSGSGEGPDASTGKSYALIDMKNKAAEMKANVVVSKLEAERFSSGVLAPTSQLKGQGFFCHPDLMPKFTDAEGL